MANKQEWLDISIPLRVGMIHWPGDPPPSFDQASKIGDGSDSNLTVCRFSAHTGTHLDAPRHFLANGQAADTFPLEVGIGLARVIEFPDGVREIGASELKSKGIQQGERLLLKTRNSRRRWYEAQFDEAYVGVNAEAARLLAEKGVALVGVDCLSVGVFGQDITETHRILLKAGVWILEALDLSTVNGGDYDLICLPLRIAGADGSPARAAVRRR